MKYINLIHVDFIHKLCLISAVFLVDVLIT